MAIGNWIKNKRKGLLMHGLIISAFILYCIFLAEPAFDTFERIENESRLCNISLTNATNGINYDFDRFDIYTNSIAISGWAFIEGQNTEDQHIYIVLKSDSNTYIFDTVIFKRTDVTAQHTQYGSNLDNSGFRAIIPLRKVDDDKYLTGLYIKKGNVETLQYTDKTIEKSRVGAKIIVNQPGLSP
jgi:hypothetical protein